MKAILFLFLLGLTFSYNASGAVAYAHKYCNNYNPNYNKYSVLTQEGANFVSQCMSIGGGLDFEGCEGRNTEGMFKYIYDLKRCLILKGWKRTSFPQKGSPMFFIPITHVMFVTDDKVIDNRVTYCSHTPDRCDAKASTKHFEFFSL